METKISVTDVGFDNFIKAFQDRMFTQTVINTIGLSILGIALGTVSAILFALVLNDGGMLDTLFGKNLGLMSTNSPLFWVTVCLINIWKEVGWDAIVYLSAMAGIDQGLYEAAKVDGANRLQRIWHITLPGIKPTIVVLLIMGIGGALNVGMERQMLLSNGIVQDHAMVLSWFAYVRGIGNSNYGLGTAIYHYVVSVFERTGNILKRSNSNFAFVNQQ